MKYPKLWEGASPVGESHIRALEGVDAPFLTKQGVDSLSLKKGEFREVRRNPVDLKFPYLWGTYSVQQDDGPGLVYTAVFSPEDNVARTQRYKQTYNFGTPNVDACICKVFVGDDYVLRLLANENALEDNATIFWPSIVRAVNLGREFLSSEDGHERHSVTYIDTLQISGLGRLFHSPRLFATGWADAATRFHFGITALIPVSDGMGGPTTAFAPICWTGNTGDYTLSARAFPYYPDRFHYPFNTHCIGLGKLRSAQFIQDDKELSMLNPFLAESSDHGASWSAVEHAWLTDLVRQTPTDGRDIFINNQQLFMARSALSVYLGSGMSLFYVGNAFVDSLGPSGADRYAPALFLETSGSFTRLSWPPDTWFVDLAGLKPGPFNEGRLLSLQIPTELDGVHFSFGVGCFYVGMFDDGVAKILYTHDFGSSWTISPPIPAKIVSDNRKIVGTVIAARDDGKPGHLVFAAPDYTENRLRFYSTDGDFAVWKHIGNVVKAKGDLIHAYDENHYFVNYGGQKYRPQVFPAFPDEFMAPRTPRPP